MTTAPRTTVYTEVAFDLPDPGPGRFWHGVHNARSAKTPLTLELRERTTLGDKPVVLGFSRLIGQAPTIADQASVIETAKEILIRAGDVDKFVGVLQKGDS